MSGITGRPAARGWRSVPGQFRGRVFATMESLRWATMMFSMAIAGFASEYYSPRAIGVVAGLLGVATALAWAWADWRRRIPEPVGWPPKTQEAGIRRPLPPQVGVASQAAGEAGLQNAIPVDRDGEGLALSGFGVDSVDA